MHGHSVTAVSQRKKKSEAHRWLIFDSFILLTRTSRMHKKATRGPHAVQVPHDCVYITQ